MLLPFNFIEYTESLPACLPALCIASHRPKGDTAAKKNNPDPTVGITKKACLPCLRQVDRKAGQRHELCDCAAPITKRTPLFSDWGSKNLKQVQIKKRQRHTLPQIAVPSAQSGLTSLFGMGRGEPRRNNHLKSLRQ